MKTELIFQNNKNKKIVHGIHPVEELLKSQRNVERLLISNSLKGSNSIQNIIRLADERHITIEYPNRHEIDILSPNCNHQGVLTFVEAYKYASLDDIIVNFKKSTKNAFFLILDGIVDPQNLGAIIRTGNCVGVDAVIIPKDRAVGVNSTVIKTSAGGTEYTPVIQVINLVKTIQKLKKNGVWVYGTCLEAQQKYTEIDLSDSIAIVIGNESNGISRLVKENCDFLLKIPMFGQIQSLNASVSTGILCYEVIRQRGLSS